MKIYKSQKEVDKDIKDDVLTIKGDVKFECSISIEASIKVVCGDITAGNITAGNINAGNISYYAFCCVYNFIKCLSIKAKREKYQEPICLDGKLEIKTKEDDTVEITVEGKTKTISRQSAKELNLI